MSFDAPVFLYLLFLLVPLILLYFLRTKKRNQGADFLAASAPLAEKEKLKKNIFFRIALSDFFFFLFYFFVVLSLAGPRWGTEIRPENRRGLDIVLAFDISRSMNAADCPAAGQNGENLTRMEQSLNAARGLCYRLGDVRFAAAAGKGKGVVMVPLTWDTEAVLSLLDTLDDSFLTGSGTNLESLLDAAIGAFRDNMNRRRGIILFSDGEALQGSLQAALDRAAALDIIICTVGVGTEEGARIPMEKSISSPGGFLLAPDGSEVISRREQDILVNIAETSGGIYADGNDSGSVLLLADFCRSLASVTAGGFRREPAARWQLFVFAGLLCFGFSRLLGFRGRKKTAGLALTSVFLTGLLFFSCSFSDGKLLIMEGNYYNSGQRYNDAISSYLKALDFEEASPYAGYGLGLSYYAMDESDAALEQYASAAQNIENIKGDHNELRYRLNFNTGIIQFEKEDFSDAVLSFRKALEIDSSRLDAKRNLELSLLALSRQNQSGGSSAVSSSGADGTGQQPSDSSGADAGDTEVRQGIKALYDFLRQKEQEQWRNEWTGESNSVWPDY